MDVLKRLEEYLDRSWKDDKEGFNSSSAAVSENGNYYFSGIFESRTHILNIPSEQGAIAIAVANRDPKIKEVITLVREGEEKFTPNPLVIKFLVDHALRTGSPFSYKVYNQEGRLIFFSDNIFELLPFYKPKIEPLEKIKDWKPRPNKVLFDNSKPLDRQLLFYAKLGAETHFTSKTKSLYGSSVLSNGYIYFAGVYSSFDYRLGLHSEMVASLSALMDGNKEITPLCLVSTKFEKEVPQLCGVCRQFLIEIQQKTKVPIKVICFSWDEGKKFEIELEDYLPYAWDSKKVER